MENQLIRAIQPRPVPLHFFLGGPFVAAFMALIPSVFAFVISNMAMGIAGRLRNAPVVMPTIVVAGVSYFAFLVMIGVKIFVEPGRTLYEVYPDRVEYYEGLLARHHRTVVFDQVIDVELSEGLLQQTVGVGTVTLVTQQLVAQGQAKLSNRRVSLHNVPQPKEVYDLVRGLAIGKGNVSQA